MKGNKNSNKKEKGSGKIPKFNSYEEVAEFWDTHDLTDFEDEIREVKMNVDIKVRHFYVSVDPDLMAAITKEAISKGISSESLVNLAIKEHLVGQRK